MQLNFESVCLKSANQKRGNTRQFAMDQWERGDIDKTLRGDPGFMILHIRETSVGHLSRYNVTTTGIDVEETQQTFWTGRSV